MSLSHVASILSPGFGSKCGDLTLPTPDSLGQDHISLALAYHVMLGIVKQRIVLID